MNKRSQLTRINRALRLGASALGSALALQAQQAHAAVPEAVTDAIESAGTDLVTVITAVIVAMLAFWGLRKIASKFGWS